MKTDFFPLGASHGPFWRAQSSDPATWDDDLKQMKECGMTCVSVFASWHRIEREEGVFDFRELDLIFDLAAKYDLKLTIGLGVHIGYSIYPPRWIMRRYRGTGMTDQNGHTDADGTYVQPCFEENEYRACAERYFRTLVRRYAKHPALLQWRVWGEATLGNYCRCETHCRMFRAFLRKKYGTVEALNKIWGTEGPSDFVSFDEIYPPRKQYRFYGYCEYLDWEEFLDRSLTDAVQRVNDWVKSEDSLHATLGEFWLPESNSSGGGDDLWKLIHTADQVGLSIFNLPPCSCSRNMDLMSSAARQAGKEAWVIEIQGGDRLFSAGWDEPATPSADQETLWMWQFVAHGAKGIFFWTWRPRLSDLEGGEFGFTRRDGSLNARIRACVPEFQLLQKYQAMLRASERHADIAIFTSRDAEHLASIDRIDRPDVSYYMKSVHSAYELLWREGHAVDFVGVLTPTILKNYKILLLPFTFCVSREQVETIAEFVRNGGIVIADYMLGAKDTRGFCDTVIPGFGLGPVFGIAEDEILNGTGKSFTTDSGETVAVNRYVQTCRLNGAEPFGFYNGAPVCTRHAYGKGEAIFLGTVFFHRDGWANHPENTAFFHNLLEQYDIRKDVSLEESGENVEAVVRTTDKHERLLFLLNHSEKNEQGTAILSADGNAVTVENLRTGESKIIAVKRGTFRMAFDIPPKKSGLYRIADRYENVK